MNSNFEDNTIYRVKGKVIAKQLEEPSEYLHKYLNTLRQIMVCFGFFIFCEL